MAYKSKFLLIINPIAGGNDKTDLVAATKAYAENEGIELIEYETTGENDEAKITELYSEHKPNRILVIGGDGTIKMAADALEGKDVIMGILPAGSANGLSVDLDLPTDIQENLNIAFHNNYLEMDMVCINGKKSLHLSDIGANAELIRNYEGSRIRGKLGYALQAITTLSDLSLPFIVSIEANGTTVVSEARMVVIANTQKYGTGVIINPIGIMDDGKFEIVILKSLDLFLVGKIWAGNMPMENNDQVEIISTDKAIILIDKPVSFQIDGEYCGEETRLDIEILPREMKVAIP